MLVVYVLSLVFLGMPLVDGTNLFQQAIDDMVYKYRIWKCMLLVSCKQTFIIILTEIKCQKYEKSDIILC